MGRKKGRKSKADEVFHVEVITKARVSIPETKDEVPSWEYFVKWAGYDSDANSWEPQANLEACQRLLTSFWAHIGLDNDDYPPGHEVKASKEWIESEKKFFATEYNAAQDEIKRLKDEKRKKVKKEEGKSVSLEPSSASVSHPKKGVLTDSESSEQQTSEELPKNLGKESSSKGSSHPPLKITIPPSSAKKRKTVISSSSSDDEPLQSTKTSRPQKMAKIQQDDVTENEVIEISSSPVNKSPTSLFSEPSSPEAALSSKKPPKKLPPPKLPRRGTNPQAIIASMAPSNIPSAGGISTKQRLAQGALAPTLPKEIVTATSKHLPRPIPKKSLLGELSFKKRKPSDLEKPQPPREPVQNEPTLASLNSPLVQSPSAVFFSPSTSFTQPARFASNKASMSGPTISPSVIFSPEASALEVDSFLHEIMPAGMSAPLNPPPESPAVEVALPKSLHAKAPLPTRISKDKLWKWTGPMHTESAETPYCKVQIHNPTTNEQSLRFSMIFDKMEKLELSSLYTVADIRSILSIFRKPSQMAQLSPLESEDTLPFAVLSHYLERSRKVFLVPMKLDNNIIGQALCFPYTLHPVFRIDVPHDMFKPGELVMAIMPYPLSPVDLVESPLTNPTTSLTMLHLPRYTPPKDQVRHPLRYHHALSMLNFPPSLVDYVAHPEHKRPYTIWAGKEVPGAQYSGRKGLETRLLEGLLDHAKAPRATSRSNVRIIFVHLGALKSVQHLPEFVERRANHPELLFYLYGSDPSVDPALWRVQEIWPCGGIATFTPKAFAQDPLGAQRLLVQLARHPLWASYIVPTALGMLACLECGAEEPLNVFDQRPLAIDRILEAIEDGDVALLEAPPEAPTADARARWLARYITFLPPTRREALAQGVAAFRASQARAIDGVVAADLGRVQRHPAFMFTYRRYVVVCGEDEVPRAGAPPDGFEWTTTAKFDFKDEWYPKQTVGGR